MQGWQSRTCLVPTQTLRACEGAALGRATSGGRVPVTAARPESRGAHTAAPPVSPSRSLGVRQDHRLLSVWEELSRGL